nr:cytochrome P450 3049D1 [Brachionus rubens]
MLELILVSSIGLAITFLTLRVYFNKLKYKHIPGPRTRGFLEFFWGNLNEINQALKRGKIVPEQYIEWSKNFGPIFKFEIFNNFIVVVTDPESIKEVLVTKNFPKPKLVYKITGYPFGERFLGSGIVSEMDELKWRERRRIFNHGFKNEFLFECVGRFNLNADEFCEKLKLKADGKNLIDLSELLSEFTLNVISSVALGIQVESNQKLNELIAQSLEGINQLYLSPMMTLNPLNYKKIKKCRESIRALRSFAKKSILERLDKIKNNEYIPGDDILSFFMNKLNDEKIDLELLIDDFITFLNAGQETTANALSFCLLELSNNPNVLNKLSNEIELAIGERNQIRFEDLQKLEYLDCVFKETLRKYPPAVQFLRESNEDCVLNGYFIPKGTWIAVSPFVMGRCSEYFKNPDEFRPERFLEEKNQNYTFIPFSTGPRNCIGMKFAQIEAKILLVKLLQNFKFNYNNEKIKYVERVTLRPLNGCKCSFKIKE